MVDVSPLALTLTEAVAAAKLSRSEIYRALQRGDLTAKKQGRRTLILREELSRYLSALPNYQIAA
jgi:excisionase family DNA binding protein